MFHHVQKLKVVARRFVSMPNPTVRSHDQRRSTAPARRAESVHRRQPTNGSQVTVGSAAP